MALLFYYLLLPLSLFWLPGSTIPTRAGRCTYEFIETRCRYEVYCDGFVDISFRNEFEIHDNINCPLVYCRNCGNNFNEIFVVLKNYHEDESNYYDNDHLIISSYSISRDLTYSLDLSNNELSTVPIWPEMYNLNILNLSSNALTEAKLSNLYELEALKEIDLSHNTINSIQMYENEYLYRKLEKINLSHNYIVAIQEAIFDSFMELKSLDISHNFINSLNMLTFEGIKNLENLNLKHNRLSELGSSMLRFSKLTDLNLSENKIENIRIADFLKLSNLKNLDLSSNLINNVEKNAFKNLKTLELLNLQTNLIENLDKDTFVGVDSLEDINLSNNKIKVLPKYIFKDKQIKNIYLTNNVLEGSLTKGTFEGLNLISNLDLSYQKLTVIEDIAFNGLINLKTLLLNDNYLHTLSKRAFDTLRFLTTLDLSNNQLTNIEFSKDDLVSLQTLLLQKNRLIQVKFEFFSGLNMLEFLDLSNNNISQLETNSFHSLNNLINIQLSNNPISGTLEKSTFDGLNSLPILDISSTLLTTVKNGSFNGMTLLKDLNISHSKIYDLQFNSFSNTGLIETIDLSFNELTVFQVNTTELRNLVNLILNNNLITILSPSFVQGLPRITKIIVSYNKIETVSDDVFLDQTDIRYLDFSHNLHLKFNVDGLEKFQNLQTLLLSAVNKNLTFVHTKELQILQLEMSYSEICNISALGLKKIKKLDDLVLSHNNVIQIEVGDFTGVQSLRKLDLSFNKITFIQPGAFKDNSLLFSLNISHNFIKAVNYGIFRGLMYLDTIDISFNELSDLKSERFYEVHSLSTLIVDHNKIDSVNADEFAGTSLSTLSLGDNPIPCEVLVNLKKTSAPFIITAIRLQENSNFENVDGVTCNMGRNYKKQYNSEEKSFNDNILLGIKDILQNMSLSRNVEKPFMHEDGINSNADNLFNLTNKISVNGKTLIDIKDILQNMSLFKNTEKISLSQDYFLNLTDKVEKDNAKILSTFAEGNNNTNSLLDKIYKAITYSVKTINSIPMSKENVTLDYFIPYIEKVKQDLKNTIAIEKQNILNEIDNKISATNMHKDLTHSALVSPNHDAYSTEESSGGDKNSFLFIDICVGMILLILIMFILYKFYNSGMFVPSRRSSSTRYLPDAIENSNL